MSRPLLAVLSVLVLFGRLDARAAPPEIQILPSGLRPEDVEQRPYLGYARECLDLLIQDGTDRYGKVRGPMLMNILDVRARTCPEDPEALDQAFRVIRRERRGPAGGNLYADQPTMRAFCLLSRATGDPRYAKFADQSAGYTIKNLVDEKGFFWWGWHRHYDAFRDRMDGHAGNPHEIHVQQALWPELYRVDPKATLREIEAVWQWHVIDKTTGEVNRHGDGQRGCDFAMSGGEVCAAFAFLYGRTKEQAWLDRARLVAGYYWKARHPQSGLVPNRPNAGAERFDGGHFDTSITGLMCPRLLAATQWSGDPAFRDQAVAYLRAYAKHGFDPKARKFWGSLKLDGTPVPGPRVAGGYAQYEPRGHIDVWQPYAAGYEHPLPTAMAYAAFALATGDGELREAARRWADFLRAEFPPRRCEEATWYAEYARQWAPHGTYAGLYGQAITFCLQMHRLTGDAENLQFARRIAREAVSRLYYRGLLRGHPAKPYYEAMDGVGYLVCALVQLDRTISGTGQGQTDLENW